MFDNVISTPQTPALSIGTPCSSSPVDNFAGSASLGPNYNSPAINEKVCYPGHNETLSPLLFGKIGGPH